MLYDIEYARQKVQEATEQELDDLWLNTEHDCKEDYTVHASQPGKIGGDIKICADCLEIWEKTYALTNFRTSKKAA